MRTRPILTAFNGGEASPLMGARTDFAKYPTLCRRLENFIPLVQGAVTRRPGTGFVRKAKGKCWLVPFEYSVDQAYMLEAGDSYLRIHLNHGTLLDGAAPLELVTPWTLPLSTDGDGACRLRHVQSRDVMYWACAGVPQQKLSRLGATNWTLERLKTRNGPFKDLNDDKAVTVYASAASGSITLTASADIFLPGHVGALFFIEMKDGGGLLPWEPGQVIAVDDLRRSDGKIYRCTAVEDVSGAAEVTGTVKPVHTYGRVWDGHNITGDDQDNGAEWEFIGCPYGFVEITAVASGTSATATVTGDWDLPPGVVGAGNATWRWAHAAYSDVEGWPEQIAFFRNRLVFARGSRVDCSVAADYQNFASKDYGVLTAEMAVALQIQSQRNNRCQWLAPTGAGLLIGTAGGEFLLSEQTSSEPFGPENAKAAPVTAYGSRGIVPPLVGATSLFIARAGRKLRAAAYSVEADGFTAPDQTWVAEHITASGVIGLAWADQPHALLWGVRVDGQLIAFTFDADQQVYAWSRHPMRGKVEAIGVIPAPQGDADELWLSVAREIDGETVRHIEYLTPTRDATAARDEWWHVDAGLMLRSDVDVTSVTGLDHLEGETVQVAVDGASHPDAVVTAGAIALVTPGRTILAGLPAPAVIEPMTLDVGGGAGTAQTLTQRIAKVSLRLVNTGGLKVGPDTAHLDQAWFREPADIMGAAAGLFTGDYELDFDGPWGAGARFTLVADGVQPCTLVGAVIDITTNG
ncbi:hypothetical protein [Zavarzinia aquatilis]|uniref:Uncharacterized protein n=1 Tax=Zavarzinia aquatilis TaxID=2211142 RepID=A0A317EHS6_9PROT|nr:hypothetical protein [Zavarzinia aquatilis]PWR24983.1 hypothetical protein DKG74_04230 [Zavarzinia aquatilis]